MSWRWLQRSWPRSQWTAVSEKAVEWCEDLPSYVTTHVQKMELTETIGVTLKDGVWCWATDLTVVHRCIDLQSIIGGEGLLSS